MKPTQQQSSAHRWYDDAWREVLMCLFGHAWPSTHELASLVCTGRYESIESATYIAPNGKRVVLRWSDIDYLWHVEIESYGQ